MELLSVLVAALAGFVLGAVWYMALSKPWMDAAGIKVGADGRPEGGDSSLPFVIAAVAMLLVAGMMRHIFSQAGIDGAMQGAVAGLGIGLFFVLPWVAMNYAFAKRPIALTLIDGGYAVAGCLVIGSVLGLF